MMMDIIDYYKSSDLALATAISFWYPLEDIDWTENPHKAKFIFKHDKKFRQFI